jgi:general secretion pathway protein M
MSDAAATAPPPASGSRRWLALALLGLAVLALLLLVTLPLFDLLRDTGRRARAAAETAARLEYVATRRPALEAELAELRKAAPIAGLFLAAGSEGQGSATLQDLVKQAASAAGATLITMQTLPSASETGYRRIPLKVLLTADTPALQKLLHALESARPVAVLDSVYVRARSGQAGGPAIDRLLEINLEVVGFQRMAAG